MREPAYEPSPQVKPVVLSPFDVKIGSVSRAPRSIVVVAERL